ncbi:MAG: SH3 domain-containing protein [Bdellovibrionales bacterium]|nr:SH3 domain-containing protein [Bdellovibrionales bacterium]
MRIRFFGKGALLICGVWGLLCSQAFAEQPETPATTGKLDVALVDAGLSAELSAENTKLKEEEEALLRKLSAKQKNSRNAAASGDMVPLEFDSPPPNAKVKLSPPKDLPSRKRGNSQSATLITSLQSTNQKLSKELRAKEAIVAALQKELDATQSRLLVAETEVERLSARIDDHNRSSLASIVGVKKEAKNQLRKAPAPKLEKAPPSQTTKLENTNKGSSESSLPIVTVIKDKVALRTGPGKNNSPLMHVSKGTRLTVETRSGEWYRVNTPDGTRAWVSGQVVQFASSKPASAASNSSTLRIRGYDASVEDEAFELIKRSTN